MKKKLTVLVLLLCVFWACPYVSFGGDEQEINCGVVTNHYDADIHTFRTAAGNPTGVSIRASGTTWDGFYASFMRDTESPGFIMDPAGASFLNSAIFSGSIDVYGYIYDGGNSSYYINSGGTSRFNHIVLNSYAISSDRDLKKDIKNLSGSGSLEKVLQLQGVSFRWKYGEYGVGENLGLIAQEVEEIYPEVVIIQEDGFLSVRYSDLVAPLIEAIKEQQKQIEELREEIRTIKEMVL